MCQERNHPCDGEDEGQVEKDLEASHPVRLFGHRRPPPERLSHLPRLLAAPFAADDATEDWGDQGSSAFAGMLAAASNTATRDSTTRVNVSIRQLCALERLRGGARPHFSDDLRPNPRVAPARRPERACRPIRKVRMDPALAWRSSSRAPLTLFIAARLSPCRPGRPA